MKKYCPVPKAVPPIDRKSMPRSRRASILPIGAAIVVSCLRCSPERNTPPHVSPNLKEKPPRHEGDRVIRLSGAGQPIAFSIGTIDPRFGISKERFLDLVEKARSIWEQSAGHALFHHDP